MGDVLHDAVGSEHRENVLFGDLNVVPLKQTQKLTKIGTQFGFIGGNIVGKVLYGTANEHDQCADREKEQQYD